MKYKLILILGLMLCASACFAAFSDLGAGGRPLGMGHAFTGVADDINSVYYNPAGLMNIKKLECTFMYAPLFMGLTDKSSIADYYGAYAQSLDSKSAFAIGFLSRSDVGPGFTEAQLLYQEAAFYASYARKLFEKLSVGATLKVPYHQYGNDYYTTNALDDNGVTTGGADPTFVNGYIKMGVAFDAGLLYNLTKNISLGLMLQNFASTNLALSEGVSDYLPFNAKVGLGWKLPNFSVMEDMIVCVDAAYRLGGVLNDAKLHTGFESWFMDKTIAARTGFGIGTNSYSDVSLGGSYIFTGMPEIQLDYAWVYPLSGVSKTTAGNHRVSCVVRIW